MILVLFPWSAMAAGPGTSCFPMVAGIRALVQADRLEGRPVFVEEVADCGRHDLGAAQPSPAPSSVTGRQAIDDLVRSANAARPGHAYQVVELAGGWVVAPVGKEPIMDRRVSLDADTHPTVAAVRATLFSQLAIQDRIWIPPATNPFDAAACALDERANTASFVNAPVAEVLEGVYTPHDPGVVGFAILIDDATVDALGRRQARFEVLHAPPPEMVPDPGP
ncbi:MAG: hypothetical protein H6735_11865 [Alphaproteobacteria bacterium]|nr:hypothetical protein [Alphaproteobacteria bacterium]